MHAWLGRLCVLVVVALLSIPAGRASASTAALPPEQWASNLCTAVVSWGTTMSTRFTSFNRSLRAWKASSNPKISTLKRLMVADLHADTVATDRLVSRVKNAGPPDIPGGSRTQVQINTALKQLDGAVHGSLRRARALPTNNRALFLRGINAFIRDFYKDIGKLGAEFAAIDKGAPVLDVVISVTPACQKLR